MEKILINGAAGFIGCHTTKAMLKEGFFVVGLDNMNSDYPISPKEDRLQNCGNYIKKDGPVFISSSLFDNDKLELQENEI